MRDWKSSATFSVKKGRWPSSAVTCIRFPRFGIAGGSGVAGGRVRALSDGAAPRFLEQVQEPPPPSRPAGPVEGPGSARTPFPHRERLPALGARAATALVD